MAKKKPCKECPFRRDNTLTGDKPGGSDPMVYIGQTQGPFWLPCHMEKNYNGKDTDPKAVGQCAGAAIYRSNINLPYPLPEELLSLPEDHETVFSSHAEFLSHYSQAPVEACQKFLRPAVLKSCLIKELREGQVKRVTL